MWAKAGRGVWGLAHVFDGQLYYTRDIVDSSVVKDCYKLPRPKPPPPPPPPPPQPFAKKAPAKGAKKKGEHVQLFRMRMRYKKGKGFYSEAVEQAQ